MTSLLKFCSAVSGTFCDFSNHTIKACSPKRLPKKTLQSGWKKWWRNWRKFDLKLIFSQKTEQYKTLFAYLSSSFHHLVIIKFRRTKNLYYGSVILRNGDVNLCSKGSILRLKMTKFSLVSSYLCNYFLKQQCNINIKRLSNTVTATTSSTFFKTNCFNVVVKSETLTTASPWPWESGQQLWQNLVKNNFYLYKLTLKIINSWQIRLYFIDTDEIPGFYLLLKIISSSREDTVFIFHVWGYWCRHGY